MSLKILEGRLGTPLSDDVTEVYSLSPDASRKIEAGHIDNKMKMYKHLVQNFIQSGFARGKKYIIIHGWDDIKDKVTLIELCDIGSKRVYRISKSNAARHGQWLDFNPSSIKAFCVPTQYWVIEKEGQ